MTAANKEVFRYGHPNFVQCQIAYSQSIKKGEMLKKSSTTGLCVPVTAASDNDTFWAIANQEFDALAADDSLVHTIRGIVPDPACVFEFAIASTALSIGSGLAISDSQTLAIAATDHVCVSLEKGTKTSVKVAFLTPPLWGGASQASSFTAG